MPVVRSFGMSVSFLLVIGFLLLINLIFWVISVAKKLKNKPITTAFVCNTKPYLLAALVAYVIIALILIPELWLYYVLHPDLILIIGLGCLISFVAVLLITYPIYVINGIKEKSMTISALQVQQPVGLYVKAGHR